MKQLINKDQEIFEDFLEGIASFDDSFTYEDEEYIYCCDCNSRMKVSTVRRIEELLTSLNKEKICLTK